jgi:ABC-type sulfate transport system substrate-binding protein
MLQSFKIIRTGSETFSTGVMAGAGIGFVATELADGTIAFGVEADFIRARMSLADINQLLPGANGIGGFTFANPVVQIKSVTDSGGNKKLTLETAE